MIARPTTKRPMEKNVELLFTISEIPRATLNEAGVRTLVMRGWRARDAVETHYVLEEKKYGRYCLAHSRDCPAVGAVNRYEENKK